MREEKEKEGQVQWTDPGFRFVYALRTNDFANLWGKMIATGTLVLETGVLPVVFSLGGEECRAENRHESSEGAFLAYVVL